MMSGGKRVAGGDVRSCIVVCIDILTYVQMGMGEGVLVCWSAILLCQARSTSSRGEMSLECVLAGAVGATGRASGENGRAMAYISIWTYVRNLPRMRVQLLSAELPAQTYA